MKTHHRDYPYRPPRTEEKQEDSSEGLYWRFVKAYVWPQRWAMLFCLLLVSANSCSVYLMSFYTRLVVDNILVIKPDAVEEPDKPRPMYASDRERASNGRPRQGLGKRMDLGFSLSDQPPEAGRRLLFLAMMYMGTQILLNVLARLANRRRIVVAQGITSALRQDMHRKVMELHLAYHQAHSPGRLLSRILSDVAVVQNQMMTTLTELTRCVALILVGTAILLTTNWQMGCIAFAALPLYAWVVSRARPLIRELNQEVRHTNSCLFALSSQKFDAMKAIQAYGREKSEMLNFHRLAACFLRDALGQQRVSAKLTRSTTLISAGGNIAIFLVGTRFVLDGRLSLGEMMFVRATAMTLFEPVMQLTRLGITFSTMHIALQRIASVLDHPVDIEDAPDAVDFPRPFRQGLELRHVSFAYPAGEDSDEVPVLMDVSLQIPSGTQLCVMGASGCGKTTLLYLLTRLFEPTSGQILLDGIPLGRIRMASLRQAVGFVPQEAQIFSGTVRDNICYGLPDASPNQIMDAAKAAQLHDFILEMKVQYETLLGQKGASLSGGQRQRLSLARALLTNPEVLILDDCTSALDAHTEEKIQHALTEILVGKTAVIVSQRVSMAKRCQRICTLENGLVSEYGTHEELVRAGGVYARLHAQQTE